MTYAEGNGYRLRINMTIVMLIYTSSRIDPTQLDRPSKCTGCGWRRPEA